jgi:hypothetical protein
MKKTGCLAEHQFIYRIGVFKYISGDLLYSNEHDGYETWTHFESPDKLNIP